MREIIRMVYIMIGTMSLGLLLLFPFVNLLFLRHVIHLETGILTDYWKRPFGYNSLYGEWLKKPKTKKRCQNENIRSLLRNKVI